MFSANDPRVHQNIPPNPAENYSQQMRTPTTWMAGLRVRTYTGLPLWQACAEGDAATVRQLVRQGHSVNSYGHGNIAPPIFAAIEKHQNRIVNELYWLGVDLSVINNMDHTPLMWACHHNIKTVLQLVILGADPCQTNNRQQTALHIAVELCRVSVVRCLLREAPSLINMRDINGMVPLMYSCTYGSLNSKIVQNLLEYGAEVNITDNRRGRTVLHLAASAGNVEVVEHLLQACTDVNVLDRYALTPLHLAMINDHTEIVHKLFKAGAQVEVVNPFGETALFFACRFGNMELFRALLPYMHLMELDKMNCVNEMAVDLADLFGNRTMAKKLRCIMQQMSHIHWYSGLIETRD